MMKKVSAVVLGCMILLTGCFGGVSHPASFYMLAPDTTLPAVGHTKTSIGVLPVEVPDFLDKPQIVLNETDTELNISESNRWSEPISFVTQRVLVEDLQRLLPNAYVQTKGYDDNRFNRFIKVDISTMTGRLGGDATLSVWWTITNTSGQVITRNRFDKTIKVGQTYADYVQSQSILWGELSRVIASRMTK